MALFLAAITLLVASAILVPIIGIRRAMRRLERGQRSRGAVTWSGINVVVFGVLTIAGFAMGAFHPIAPGGLILNGIWLMLAIRTNRAADRRANGPSP
jgi:hypothetical protein